MAEPVHPLVIGGFSLFRYDDVFSVLRDPVVERRRCQRRLRGDVPRGAARRTARSSRNSNRFWGMDLTRPHEASPAREQGLHAADDRGAAAAGRGDGRAVARHDGGRRASPMSSDRLAFPLPFDVISEMLGMPEADKDQIREWSGAIVKTLDPILGDDELAAAFAANTALNRHLDAVIEWKRLNPADDLLTALIEAEEDGDRLTAKELRDQVSLLFVAGHETTVKPHRHGHLGDAAKPRPERGAAGRCVARCRCGRRVAALRRTRPVLPGGSPSPTSSCEASRSRPEASSRPGWPRPTVTLRRVRRLGG